MFCGLNFTTFVSIRVVFRPNISLFNALDNRLRSCLFKDKRHLYMILFLDCLALALEFQYSWKAFSFQFGIILPRLLRGTTTIGGVIGDATLAVLSYSWIIAMTCYPGEVH